MELNLQLFEDIKAKVPSIPRRCLQLLQDKERTSIVVADEKMVLHIYEVVDKDLKEVYKSPAFEGSISCVTVSDELVFFNVGGEVKAVSRKGKEMYSFNTFHAGNIENILVWGFKLFVLGSTVVNEFLMEGNTLANKSSRRNPPPNKKTEDVSVFLSEDDIHDAIVYSNDKEAYCLLQRSNNQIQIIDNGKAIFSYQTGSSPCQCSYLNKEDRNKFIMGLSSGEMIALEINRTISGFSCSVLWTIKSAGRKVTCVIPFPKGLIVTRSNEVQIWFPDEDEYSRVWKKTLDYTVSNCHYLQRTDEILLSTVNGQVVGLSNYEKKIRENKAKIEETKVTNLQAEMTLEKLESEKRILLEREPPPQYKLKHSLTLNQLKQCWMLEISSTLPITNIVFIGITGLKSEHTLEFESVAGDEESQVFSIPSLTEIQFQLKLKEGSERLVQCYVTLQSKVLVAVNISLEIKTLCMHYKVGNTIQHNTSGGMHSMRITGAFTKTQMNIFLLRVFNETVKTVPEGPITLVYQSLLTGEKLFCVLDDKTLTVEADSTNPLMIIKRNIQMRSKEKDIPVTVDVKPNPKAIEYSLGLAEPEILELEKLQREYRILPELAEMEKESGQLSPNFREILGRREDIQRDFALRTQRYESLKEWVLQMLVSYKNSQNQEPTPSHIESLKRKLQKFSLQDIKASIL